MGKIYKNGIEYGGGGGDSAGHIILDDDGTAMAAEPNLQFKGLNVTDNSTDEITEVESAGLNQDSMDDVLNASISGNQVASNGMSYSTEEQVIGKWVNGKPLYQKTINFGALPNATAKYVAHGVANLDRVVDLKAVTAIPAMHIYIPLSAPGNESVDEGIRLLTRDATSVCIETQRDRSAYTDTYVTIQYTKTTD